MRNIFTSQGATPSGETNEPITAIVSSSGITSAVTGYCSTLLREW